MDNMEEELDEDTLQAISLSMQEVHAPCFACCCVISCCTAPGVSTASHCTTHPCVPSVRCSGVVISKVMQLRRSQPQVWADDAHEHRVSLSLRRRPLSAECHSNADLAQDMDVDGGEDLQQALALSMLVPACQCSPTCNARSTTTLSQHVGILYRNMMIRMSQHRLQI